MSEERWAIAANVIDDGAFRRGAKVLIKIIPGDPENVLAIGRSIGGRVIEKWIASKRLKNIRPAFLPPSNSVIYQHYPTKALAAAEIAARFSAAVVPQPSEEPR